MPITINEGENTIRIDQTGWSYLDICNHEEADSRIPLHAAVSNTDCMIVSNDTDVFLFLIYAFYKCKSQKTWYMKYDNDKYVDIGKVFVYLGINMTENLLKFRSLTGCDSTSYFYRVGKIKVWKKLLKNPENMHLRLIGLRAAAQRIFHLLLSVTTTTTAISALLKWCT